MALPVMDKEVATHMQRCKGLSGKVGDPVTDLIVPSRDETTVFAVECVGNG